MCTKCRTVNPSEARVCASCGTLLVSTERSNSSKSPGSASRSKQAPSGPRRGLRSDVTALTEMGDDPASTTGDAPLEDTIEREPTPPPRSKVTRQSMPNVAGSTSPATKPSSRVSASSPSTLSSAHDTLIGQKLQEYVIQERIGVGGMGVVYRAVQVLIGKAVAFKVLRSDVVTDPRDVDRMLEEARIINSIKHRGIINIFGAGMLDDGRQYLIMELLEGESLEQLMHREGKVPASDAVVILEEVLSALGAAHAAGVVHRDLKPANVFLVKEGNKNYVKLLDFGLARRLQQDVTRIAGTPDYISPEHARGRPAGPPADLYSFGILCFHMLTGTLPFTGNTPMEVMEKHVHHEPPVPHEINPAIPKALSELILKLLSKEPGARPDADQVKADLRAATKQLRNASTMMSLMSVAPVVVNALRPSAKGQQSEDERARELAVKAEVADVKRRVTRRWPLMVGGMLGLWLLGVLIYALWPARTVMPPKPVYAQPFKGPMVVASDSTTNNPTTSPIAPDVAPTVAEETNPRGPEGGGGPHPDVDETSTGVLGKFVDNNSVVDDVTIGEFRREERDGQSIDRMLNRMNEAIKSDEDKKELFERALHRVNELCAAADTKRKLIDCDDEARKLHERFFRL
jgi:tRNA A-37 threonylcarbamoyl transferase component Bud32